MSMTILQTIQCQIIYPAWGSSLILVSSDIKFLAIGRDEHFGSLNKKQSSLWPLSIKKSKEEFNACL